MTLRVYTQDDGRFAVFSSVVDAFLFVDATEEELRQYLRTEKNRPRSETTSMIEKAQSGEWSHHACPPSYERAQEIAARCQ